MSDYVEMGVLYAKAGLKNFGEWSKQMVDDVGEWIKPHLENIWNHPNVAATRESGRPAGEQKKQTSIKNAVVDQERANRGLPPAMQPARRAFGEVWDNAMRIASDQPLKQDALIRELKEKPRAVIDTEDALLLHRQIELQNEYDKTLERLDTAQKNKNNASIAEIEAQEELLGAQLLELYDINKAVGTATSRGLNARKMLASEDFSLVKMLAQKRKAKGVSELSAEDAATVRKQNRTIKELEAKLTEATAKTEVLKAEKAATQAINKVVASVPRERSRRYVKARAEVDAAWKEFISEATGKLSSVGGQLESVPSAMRLAKAYVNLGVVKFQDFMADVTKRIGRQKAEKAKPALERAWNIAREEAKPKSQGEFENKAEISRYAQKLAEYFVGEGITKRDPLIDAVHRELEGVVPGITRRETMDAISGYGDFRPLNKDAIKVQVRDLKGQMQQIAKLEDMQAGQAPSKTGVERRTPSDEERRLIQQVNEMKKKGGFVVTDPAKQLRTALDAVKARLTHQIADFEQQIATRQKIVKQRTAVILDAEAQRLQQRRDALKKDFDAIFGQRELTDAQRIANATKAVERSIAEYTRRIAERDLAPRKKVSKTPVTPELESLRAQREALKQEYQHLKDLANPKMTPEQRALSALKANLRRRIADYEDRLARSDFAPKVRKETRLDPEAEKLRYAAEKAKTDFMEALAADRWKKRTVLQKAKYAVNEVLSLPIALKSSIDYSAMLRQGKYFFLGHPIEGMRAARKMVAASRSEANASRIANELANRPNAAIYKRSKLPITDPKGELTQREEVYVSTWAQKIPFVAGSGRAYVAFLNEQRADRMDALLANIGRSGTVTEAEAKVIANFVADFTGRANMKELEMSGNIFAKVFWTPKFVASRFRVLLLHPLWRGWGHGDAKHPVATARVRKEFAKEYARTLTGLGIYYSTIAAGLYALAGPPGKDEEWDINLLDTNSPEWGTIRIGNTRIDPLAGIKQCTIYLSRMVTGKKTTGSGRVVSLSGPDVPYKGDTRADISARFLRQKTAPLTGTIWNILKGENLVGEPVTPLTVLRDLSVPMSIQDIYEAMLDEGVSPSDAAALLTIPGEGIQTYSPTQTFPPAPPSSSYRKRAGTSNRKSWNAPPPLPLP
ncbi:MAG: hypothetical protein ABIH23_08260 [bacterium]